jgi:hypothetical protein
LAIWTIVEKVKFAKLTIDDGSLQTIGIVVNFCIPLITT